MKGSRTIKSAMKLIFLIGTVVFLLSGCDRTKVKPTLGDVGPAIGLSFPGAGTLTITKDLVRQAGQKKFRSIEAAHGSRLLKIEIMAGLTQKEAEKMQEERMNIIRSLFSNLPSPYPGMVTNTVVVDDELKPQLQMIPFGDQELPLYILMSSSRYTYGAVPTEMVTFLGGLFFLHDQKNGTLYRFDYFVPKEEFQVEEFVQFFSKIELTKNRNAIQPEQAEKSVADTAKVVIASADPKPSLQPPLKFKGYNLLLIAFEPLGANHLSCYGYNRQTTPHLDAFAKEAILFENAVSPSSWSLPVFMSWFTSLYPSQHKVTNKYSTYSETEQVLANLAELTPEAVTMTQVLQHNGYHSAAYTGGASLSGDFGFRVGFETYYDEKKFGGFDTIMPMALSWLTEKRREPFFLFVQGYDVHGQFPLKKENLSKFLGTEYKGSYTGAAEEYWQLRNRSINEGTFPMPEEDIRFWKAVYDTKISEADAQFGSFIAQLKKLELLEKTIIVVSSGSGNEHQEHGRIDHGFSLYEELLHVPLIIRIPKQQPRRITQLVRTIDIMPTVVDLLDIGDTPALAEQMQGVSLVPLIEGEEMVLDGISETDYLLHAFKRSIKTNDGWKLIVSLDTEKRELYFLKDDPSEQNNVIQGNGRTAYELEQRLFTALQRKVTKK